MLKLNDISFSYGEKSVLSHFSHTFPTQGIFLLTGASGCGKTTLLKIICGLLSPSDGTVEKSTAAAMSFQEPRLIPHLNCYDNIKFVLLKNNNSFDKVDRWMEILEIASSKNSLPATLSGGMQKRVSLARALATGADILLLDEPFSSLDEALKKRIAPHIEEVGKKSLVLITDHQKEDALLLHAPVLSLAGTPATSLVPLP